MCGQSVEIEEMPSYESVKSSVRLLLTSASNGLTLDQLNADYQHYHQLTSIPYAAFGYSTLVNFLLDMPDVAQVHLHSDPPIVYGVKTIARKPTRMGWYPAPSLNHNHPKSKPVKRLVLQPLSTNVRPYDRLVVQLKNLVMETKPVLVHENLLTLKINATDQCYVVRYSNGKFYIPCFELARLLRIHENLLDQETMFSRLRIYSSHDMFNLLKDLNQSCQHRAISRRPYVFLFNIASVLFVLKTKSTYHPCEELVLAFERLLR